MSALPAGLRVSMQAKVLAVLLCFLILLPVFMVWVVDEQTSALVRQQAQRALATAELVMRKSLEIRERNQLARYRNIVSQGSFKGAVTLQDKATLTEYLRDLLGRQGEEAQVMIFFDEKGEIFAGARRDASFPLEALAKASTGLLGAALQGAPGVEGAIIAGRAQTVMAVPVTLGPDSPVKGVVVIGNETDEGDLQELKILTGSEVTLFAEGRVIVSTLPGMTGANDWMARVAAKGGTEPVEVGGEHFLALSVADTGGGSAHAAHYLLLSSYERSMRSLADTRRTLLLVSVGGILCSAFLVWFLISRITRPLRELRDSAEAVGRGDFSRRIVGFPNDECGDLAVAFNTMTGSLQTSDTELRKTVETLKATQGQLIQSEKLSAVGQFVAGVAHELNNPLTAVIGFSDMLATMSTDKEMKPHLEVIAKSAHRCHKIVQNLLGFARQHPPERKLVAINELVDEVIEIMAYDLRTSNITIVQEYTQDRSQLLADPHQLQQVFINILGNARQAIQALHRSGEIRIKTAVMNGLLYVEFCDNGPGIRPDNLAKIFDPFFTTKPVGKGTGLGLSLSYGIIQEHGGKISVQSVFGRGATFVIELPTAPADAVEAEEAAKRSGTAPPFAVGSKAVLIVDDEEWILALGRELLSKQGYAVEMAASGEEALEHLGRRRFDVIVSDWKMPGLNGMQLYEHLLVTDPGMARRFIFMTGDVVNESFQELLNRHRKTCLPKPFSIAEFRSAVAAIIRAEN